MDWNIANSRGTIEGVVQSEALCQTDVPNDC